MKPILSVFSLAVILGVWSLSFPSTSFADDGISDVSIGSDTQEFHRELNHVERDFLVPDGESRHAEKKEHRHETFAAIRKYLEMRDGKLDPYDLAATESGLKIYKHMKAGEMDTYTQASGDARVFVDDRLKAQFPTNAYDISPEEYRIIKDNAIR